MDPFRRLSLLAGGAAVAGALALVAVQHPAPGTQLLLLPWALVATGVASAFALGPAARAAGGWRATVAAALPTAALAGALAESGLLLRLVLGDPATPHALARAAFDVALLAACVVALWRLRAWLTGDGRILAACWIATSALLALVPWARPLPTLVAILLHVALVVGAVKTRPADATPAAA